MIVTLLKFAHIATISVWAAGLISLPFLYRQRSTVNENHDLHRMHAMVRFFYVAILSPTAFVAIGSGTALIFLQGTFAGWFSLKLIFVGLLVIIHVVSGLVIIDLFEEDQHYPKWRYVAVTSLTAAVVTLILIVVSGKPEIDMRDLFADLFTPGRLGEMLAPLISWFRS